MSNKKTRPRREFLSEKLHNFSKYVQSITDVDGNEVENRDALLKDLAVYQNNLELFTHGIVNKIKPFENDICKLLDNYFSSYEIDINSLKDEDVEKIERYLLCFCKFVS